MASIADVYVDLLPNLSKATFQRELDKLKNLKVNVGAKVTAGQVKEEFAKVKGVRVNVDAKANAAQVKEEFAKVKGVRVNVEARAKADQVKEELGRFKGVKVPVEPKLDKGAAALALAGLAAVGRDKKVTIGAEADGVSAKQAGEALRAGVVKAAGGRAGGGRGGSSTATISIPFRAKIPIAIAIEGLAAAPAVVPLIGSMVQSVGQLSGAFGLIPAAATTAGLAIGSLKIATLGFADALGAIRDPEKFAEALATLSPNMQGAARSIQTLLPQIDQLKFTVQDAFGAGFADQVKGLGSTLLPLFTDIMSRMSQSAGKTLGGIARQLQTPEMQSDIKTFGAFASDAFGKLLTAAQPLVKAFTDIATVGSSFLPKLAEAVSDLATRFGDFIGEARESGKLAEWIQGGITALTQLKDIAVNTWDIFKGIFRAAGGGDFLDTVVRLTNQWSNWINSIEGQNALRDFFNDAKETVRDIWPILRNLGIALFNAFNGAKDVLDLTLPLLQQISGFLAEHERLAYAIGVAFASWQLASILKDITAIGTALLGLQATAATAGTGIRAGLISGLTLGGALTLPITLTIAGSALAIWAGEKLLAAGKTIALPVGDVGGSGLQGTISGDQSQRQNRPGSQRERRGAVPLNDMPSLFPNPAPPLPPPPRPAPGQVNRVQPPAAPPPLQAGQSPVLQQGPAPNISNYPGPPPPAPGGGGGGGAGGAAKEPQVVAGSGYTGFGEPDWEAIADAESGGNWQAATGNGYFGGLQILPETWTANGGPAGTTANMFSKEDQITVAENILQSQGPGAWPATFVWKNAGSGGSGRGYGGYSGAGYGGYGNMPVPRQPFGLTSAAQLGSVPWVKEIERQFGLQGGTRARHQTTNRMEAGFAPNPEQLIRGIDWTGQPEAMEAFAQYLIQNPELVEQLIYRSAGGRDYEIAGGKVVSGYYPEGTMRGHVSHVHTRQSASIPQAGQEGMQTWDGYTYDGPGYDRNNPMYVQPAKEETGGEQLGKDILSGIGEVFGFGDIFKDPTQFGLFKIFKAFMGLTTKEGGGQGAQGQGGQGGLPGLLSSLIPKQPSPLGTSHAGGPAQLPGQFVGGAGSAGISGLLGSIIPQPFGQLNTADQANPPGQFAPLMPQPGGGGVVLPGNVMASPFSPTGPGSVAGPGNAPVTFDQKTIFNGPVGNIREQTDAWQGADGARFRQGMKAVPQQR